jgi:hypothetical protein
VIVVFLDHLLTLTMTRMWKSDKCGILIDAFVLVYVSTVVVGISVVCAGYWLCCSCIAGNTAVATDQLYRLLMPRFFDDSKLSKCIGSLHPS